MKLILIALGAFIVLIAAFFAFNQYIYMEKQGGGSPEPVPASSDRPETAP